MHRPVRTSCGPVFQLVLAGPDWSRPEWEVGMMDGEGKDAWVVGKGQWWVSTKGDGRHGGRAGVGAGERSLEGGG